MAFPDTGPSANAIVCGAGCGRQRYDGDKTANIHGSLAPAWPWKAITTIPPAGAAGAMLKSPARTCTHPAVLGLLQVTNLALPITSPFSEAPPLQHPGQRVTFRADRSARQGNDDAGDRPSRF